jgi:tannase/feruloyl esterase
MKKFLVSTAVAALFACTAHAQSTPNCEALAKLAIPQAKITSAESVAAGALTMPTPGGQAQAAAANAFFKSLPAFCRVAVDSTPSSDSDIKIEVWLPASGWNGKFQGQGNGGFAGSIDYRSMGTAITQGYASASTDTGHSASAAGGVWALNHPEKITDFGYRAIHLMTQIAKTLVNNYYGSAVQHSYFSACSNGGRQALMEAQRYPDDYDGIIAGAPANYWTHLLAGSIWNTQALALDPASYISAKKLPAIASAVNDACDKLDGVADGILNDPRQCHFDPNVLLCKDGDADSCLTAPQITALKKVYEGAHNSHGNIIYPGFLPGAELGGNGWTPWVTGETSPRTSLGFGFGEGFFANMVYSNAGWDIFHANLDDATALADQKAGSMLNATDPNLAAFKAHGGKLIIYHGWNDPAISAINTINYYNSVIAKMGQQNTDSFVRVFMVPGMQHCGGGSGTDNFGAAISGTPTDPQHSLQLTIEQWVEKNSAPTTIIATKFAQGSRTPSMTRPLCAYPQSAKYNGAGDPNSAASFTCTMPAH